MNVLFLCVANAARSAMAEGLARRLLGPTAKVASAGTHPGSVVHPLAVELMREIGLDISSHRPKAVSSLSPAFWSDLDYLIVLGAEADEAARPPTSASVLHWPLPDPASSSYAPETRKERFRELRDELKRRLEIWIRET